jgi:predicted nucleotidyltransferase component of viral defense system
MIQLEQIKKYFPPQIQEKSVFNKYILKEYLQLLILDYLSTSPYIRKLTFIGGTSLRLVKGIDRFSEDLDFDCKDLSKDEFLEMTEKVLLFLRHNGYHVEAKDRKNDKLMAFRRNIYFPEFLFDLGLTGHREERFLIKIESQDQKISYQRMMTNIKGCGFFFPFPVPPDDVLCAMKISAMLSRRKGRDFYDVMFLLAQSKPDFTFLSVKNNISNLSELKQSVETMLRSVDLKMKAKDFEHLLFNQNNSKHILYFREFFSEL